MEPKSNKKHIVIGIIAGLILLAIYFTILSIANSFSHATEQFIEMWYWISALVIGFGIQVGLYSYIRTSIHTKNMSGATTEVATAGGISTGSMIACCAHHLTDILPILGLSAAFVLLAEYQVFFIILGILSNLVGITMMLGIIQKHELHKKRGFFNSLFRFDMKMVRNITLALSVVILIGVFIVTSGMTT
ncbi:MAG: hypothetical protein ACE5KE_06885 [Methanosarcinales archaeon]